MTGFTINPPRAKLTDENGFVSNEWYRYFAQIQAAVGTSASATWQDGFVLVPAPLAGISANDVEGGGATIPVGVVTIATDYSLGPADCMVRADTSSMSVTILLPAAATCPGRVVRAKKVDASANTVEIAAYPSELIDGAASKTISAAYDSYTLISTGLGWDAI